MENSGEQASLVNFNEIQQQLAETFNPQTAKERTKEIFANLLLGMGVPFFAERLKSKLPEDMFKKIAALLDDPDNLGKNSLAFAKKVFSEKFLEPVKNQLLDKLGNEIPELRGIDLTKMSLTDIQNTVAKGIITKMKANLPPEIADALPENFTREDILNAVKRAGADKALEFAKNNLPPEAYAELERNQEILQNPERISDFVKGKLDDLQGQVETNFNTVKSQVQARLDDVKQAIKGKIDEATQVARDKIETIKQAKVDATAKWNAAKSELNDRYKSAQKKLTDFQRDNPNASQEDLQPFQDEVKNIADRANAAKETFFNGQDDFDTQIANAQGEIENITKNLVEKVGNVRATISGKIAQAQAQGERVVAETRAAVQQGQQAVQRVVPAVQAEAEQAVARVIPAESRAAAGNMFRATEGEGETTGLFDRFSSFMGERVSQAKQFFGRFSQTQPAQAPAAAEGEEAGNIQFQQRAVMLQADEPETTFSENAMRGVMRNPGLATYYGTEYTPADQLLDNSARVRFAPYRATARPTRAGRTPRQAEPPAEQPPPPETLSPQGADQLLPMREMMAQQRQAEAQRPAEEPQRPAVQEPAEVEPQPVAPEPEVRPPVAPEPPVVPEGEVRLPSVGGVVGGAVEGVGIGMGIYQLEQGIAQRNPAQEVGGGVPLGTTAVSTAIRQGQPAAPAEAEQAAPRPTTAQQQPLTEQGEAPAPAGQPAAPSGQPAAPAAAEGEGEIVGEQTGKTIAKETGTVLGEEGGEEGLFAGLVGGLSEVPILGALVDIGGILGSIFGAKALMGEKTPPPPSISGATYEPNL